jgi:PHD/YefM family antitoxin component YafN of YafNO toxin-antitoxin module
MTSKSIEELENKVTAMLGITAQSIGKTEARQRFLPLVDALCQSATAVEITEHDKPVAMLLSYSHWIALVTKLEMLSSRERISIKQPNLIGSVQVLGDLEAGSAVAAETLTKALKDRAERL